MSDKLFTPGPMYRADDMFKELNRLEKEEQMKVKPVQPYTKKYMECEIMEHGKGLPVPKHQTEGSAGCDLYAANMEDVVIQPGAMEFIPTGIKVAVFPGFEARIQSRSGLAANNGLFVLNQPGCVDSDYRGEIRIMLANFSTTEFTVTRGMRVAQMIISAYQPIELQVVDSLDKTERGEGGFGHTGV